MALILDSNQPALMTCLAGVGRAGVCRAGGIIAVRNMDSSGVNAWTRFRAVNPAHNDTPDTTSWTTVRGA